MSNRREFVKALSRLPGYVFLRPRTAAKERAEQRQMHAMASHLAWVRYLHTTRDLPSWYDDDDYTIALDAATPDETEEP